MSKLTREEVKRHWEYLPCDCDDYRMPNEPCDICIGEAMLYALLDENEHLRVACSGMLKEVTLYQKEVERLKEVVEAARKLFCETTPKPGTFEELGEALAKLDGGES